MEFIITAILMLVTITAMTYIFFRVNFESFFQTELDESVQNIIEFQSVKS